MAETYRPPQGVRDEAKRALDWIAAGKAGSGFTDTGRKRAADLARGAALSAETVLRIHSYLSRHEVDKNGKGFSPGDDGYPSPGRVAWAAWGGDPAMSWSSKIRDQLADRSALLEESMETRELPPSYRPAASNDVPTFTPACASCIYLCAGVDETGQQSLRCTKWEAPVTPDSYCDAWEVNECCLPSWMQDDDDDDAPMMQMNSATPADAIEKRAAENDVPISDALTSLLNSVFTFYARAHEAHWNVNGADFSEYHALFGVIYEDVFDSVDDLAENVRKLGTLAPALEVESREVLAGEPAALARILLDENETLITEIRSAFDIATAAGQQGIANFLADRQDAHQKWSWQLRSSLGIAEVRGSDYDVEARRSLIDSCEKRTVETELRAERGADGVLRVRGYAATWEREATGLPFREVIKPGAFRRSLERGDDVFLLVNHDTDQLPLARRSAGTLSLVEDEVGLLIDAELDPKNPRAAELGSALERGDVDKMSFAFTVAEGGSTRTKDGLRELSDLNLFEVSVVTWPAYADTTVGLRSAEEVDLDFRKRVLAAKIHHLVLEV